MKESSLFNNVFTGLNLLVVVFVIVAGSFYGGSVVNKNFYNTEMQLNCIDLFLADQKNWALKKEDILNSTANITADKIGEGGFAPFGFHGNENAKISITVN